MSVSISRRKALIAAGLAGVGLPAIVHSQPSKKVRVLRAPWDSFWFSSYIAKTGLEQLGYAVEEPRVVTPAVMAQGLAQGDAEFTMDVVMPGASPVYAALKDKVNLLGPTVQPGSVTGYLIDKATADKYNVRQITDFRDPKIAALFAEGADKRARLIGPGAGFNDEKHAIDDMQRLGLKDTVNLVAGEYTVMVADVVARYKAGKPVFLYAWFPNVATVELLPGRDLVFLEERGANPDFAFKDVPGCATGALICNTGWSPTTYFVAGNKEWLEQNKSAAKFLAAIRVKTQDRVAQNMLMAKGEKRERDLMRHAADWIKANQAVFDGWVQGARA
jgi:glycine betaine/proline transport system substrate-binding protein